MLNTNSVMFDCQLYVPANGTLMVRLPMESGPQPVVTFRPIAYDELVDPSFRRLLAAFDSAPQTLLAG